MAPSVRRRPTDLVFAGVILAAIVACLAMPEIYQSPYARDEKYEY